MVRRKTAPTQRGRIIRTEHKNDTAVREHQSEEYNNNNDTMVQDHQSEEYKQ